MLTLATAPLDTLSAVLLAQQLPLLPFFSGDQDGESIGDWLECLELMAAMCHWEEQAKLVNVAACLRVMHPDFIALALPSSDQAMVTLMQPCM